MLVTPEVDRRNRMFALAIAAIPVVPGLVAAWYHPALFAVAILAVPLYIFLRRRIWRRKAVMNRPFPPEYERILQTYVAYFRALSDTEKDRFRKMVAVFLDEIQITGVRTSIDDTIRVLVGASAVIPVFGFHDWDYHRLGEVLIYPSSFGADYQAKGGEDENILGMVGRGHLRGIMILSKPDLLSGFEHPEGKDNVGVHEFVHEVEAEEASRGLPPEVPVAVARQWVAYVARELRRSGNEAAKINPYAYTNDHEYLAVLSEYFFNSPEALKEKAPELYNLLRDLFHQDTASMLAHVTPAKHRLGRNDSCPCGSGKKFKDCCLNEGKPGT